MAKEQATIVLLLLVSVGRCYYQAYCQTTTSIVYCSSGTYGGSCNSVGNCCKRTDISITSYGSTYTSSNSVCNSCYMPASTVTFQRNVKSTYGGICGCGQVQQIPSYYLNGYLIPSVTIISCMNQCCGDKGKKPQSDKTGIIVGSVVGLIVLFTIIGLVYKYHQDPHLFDPILAWFQSNQPIYHHGGVANQHPSSSAIVRLDQLPQNERPPDAPYPQPPKTSIAQAAVGDNVQDEISDQQAAVRVQEYSSPIKNEEHDATKAQLSGSPAEKHSTLDKRLLQSPDREQPEVIMESPQAEEHLSPSLDDRIYEDNNQPE